MSKVDLRLQQLQLEGGSRREKGALEFRKQATLSRVKGWRGGWCTIGSGSAEGSLSHSWDLTSETTQE